MDLPSLIATTRARGGRRGRRRNFSGNVDELGVVRIKVLVGMRKVG